MGIMHGSEFLVLILLAFIILGPKQLPEYARKLARLVVQVRRMANDAKGQLKEQLGPEYEELNWRQYDPRQYDPRRIVREALLEPLDEAVALGDTPAKGATVASEASSVPDEQRPAGRSQGTPWDPEAT